MSYSVFSTDFSSHPIRLLVRLAILSSVMLPIWLLETNSMTNLSFWTMFADMLLVVVFVVMYFTTNLSLWTMFSLMMSEEVRVITLLLASLSPSKYFLVMAHWSIMAFLSLVVLVVLLVVAIFSADFFAVTNLLLQTLGPPNAFSPSTDSFASASTSSISTSSSFSLNLRETKRGKEHDQKE